MFSLVVGALTCVSLFLFRFAASEKNVEISQVLAIAGEIAYLPCDISYQDDNDAIVLVLWYREDLGTPIYSVDARERDFSVAERWSDETIFASRAYFISERDPAELAIEKVQGSDRGMYRCRVDFKIAQTRNSKVNLTVIVPPQRMDITDENGDIKEAIVGPYNVDDSFMLRCDVSGGSPRPWVKWYRENIEVDTAGSVLPDGTVRGVLRVANLTRLDVMKTVTCRSSNHVRVLPVEKTLTIDMNFPPVTIQILSSNQPLSAGRRYDLLCLSSGSRPLASITWWKNGKRINSAKETVSSDGNTTTSTVSFVAHKNDSGVTLSCRAHNPSLPALAPLEDLWTLEVNYLPETEVRLGTNLDPNNIREGSDAYFDCIINALPYVNKVEWRHNGRHLVHNISKGVIISNHSLVLQSVGRHTGGNYTCIGFNSEGQGESRPFYLNVLYAPTCRSDQQRVYGVAKQERAQVTCYVDANPTDVNFRWIFNNSANNIEVGGGHVSRASTSSTVSYTPLTQMDYGTLLCWAQNRIGGQKTPCVFHIIAAGHPDQVINCSLVNSSLTSIGIRCVEGFNGGMMQSFLLEVREITSQELVTNTTNVVPRFTVVGLHPGKTYVASVFSFNSKGRSEPVLLKATTLRPPEKRQTTHDLASTTFPIPGVLSAVLGGVGAVLITCLLLLISLRQRKSRMKERSGSAQNSQDSKPFPDGSREDSETDDRNPDVVPPIADLDSMQVEYIGHRQNVSTITSPSRGACNPSIYISTTNLAGMRGYTALRPQHPALPHFYEPQSVNMSPPLRFSSSTFTLPRGGGGSVAMCQPGVRIPLQQLCTLPRSSPPGRENCSLLQTIPGDTAL